jgi:hypothetical protein
MAKKANRWQRALIVLTRGGVFSPEQLCKEMNYKSLYRISSVILNTKNRGGAIVKSVRNGRKVTGYELVNVNEMKELIKNKGLDSSSPVKVAKAKASPKVAVVETPKVVKAAKVVKAPKTPKVVKAMVPVAAVVSKEVNEFAPVDVLDMIDSNITDFEDREFAQDFIDGRL